MTDHLDRAEKAVSRKDATGALAALLDAWRERRAPAYADAIDAISKVVSANAAPLETHEAWMALAQENRADDTGPLVDGMLTPKLATFGGRVEQLCTRADDPRIAMAFAKAALEPPMTASSNFNVWTKMYDAMTRIGDTRVAELLEKRLSEPQGKSQFWPRHYKALEKILAKLPAAPKVGADEKKRLTAIVKAGKTAAPAPKAKKAKPAPPAGDPLERAALAAEAGAWRDCLNGLLDAWRPMRLAVLGSAIDRVSVILEDGRPPPSGRKVQAEWLAMAAKKDVADIGLLADSSSEPKSAEAESNMDAMTAWPEDPRIGRAMLVKLYAMTFGDRTRAWTLIGNLLLRNCDERFEPEIARLQGGESQHTDNKARNACVNRVARELGPILAKIKDELGPVGRRHLARVNAAVDAHHAGDVQTEQKLIAAIVADRESDGPLLVYADWLMERNHPRGELIVLQCKERAGTANEKEKKRIGELYSQHCRALVGPAASFTYQNLAYSISSGNLRFDRGVIDEVEVYFSPPAWTFAEEPLVRAFRRLAVAARGQRVIRDLVRVAGSIRSVERLEVDRLLDLCELEAPASVEHVGIVHWREAEDPLAAKLAARRASLHGRGLANLKSLDLQWQVAGQHVGQALPDELCAAPLMRNLERLAFTRPLATSLASIKKHRLDKIRTITLLDANYTTVGVRVQLDDALVPRAFELFPAPHRRTTLEAKDWDEIRALLSANDEATITELRVSPAIFVDETARSKLDALVAERFSGKAP